MSVTEERIDGDLELEQLLGIARAKRSKVNNLRPLKELALRKLASVDCAKTSTAPYQYLSTPLRKEILSYMAAGTFQRKSHIIQAENDWHFELASRLLNDQITEFEFRILGDPFIYSSDNERDKKMWQVLIENCPKLERIVDKRSGSHHDNSMPKKKDYHKKFLFVRNVMHHLKKFRKLKHIDLEHYVCDSKDLAQLARHFPQLQTLSVAFKLVHRETLNNLFLLQNLEKLDIHWNTYIPKREKNQLVLNEQSHHRNHFKAECIGHLPRLQYCSGGEKFHNFLPYQGKTQLCLKHIKVLGGFNCKLIPLLEELHLEGPLRMKPNAIGALSNLTRLFLIEVKDSDISDLLTHCGGKLHELEIYFDLEGATNPYEIFVKCPQLRSLDVNSNLLKGENDFFKSQVDANYFKRMRKFSYDCSKDHFPPDLTLLILTVPDLESFYMGDENWNISKDDLAHLTAQLVQGHILQSLKSFKFFMPQTLNLLNI
ncbi:uncharacterized protein LOC132198739 isoform X2 [Neocloeon triangulifer]|uniref:uncharacterized protein LOC132198739 isoform X2 n=1 Tax=Neocloeon triangulifer TaxID=2078957 RepID=UPI00286FA20D|nr:uncharacterized protein LOC132198739 isoform X2 [Neocloeon triangulifer]